MLVGERTLPRLTRHSTDHHPLRNGTADRCVSTCHGLALTNKVLGAKSASIASARRELLHQFSVHFHVSFFSFPPPRLRKNLCSCFPMIYRITRVRDGANKFPCRSTGLNVNSGASVSFFRFQQSCCVSSRHAVSYYFRSPRSLRSGTVGARCYATAAARSRVRGPRDEKSTEEFHETNRVR